MISLLAFDAKPRVRLTNLLTTCVKSANALNAKLIVWLAVLIKDQFLRDSTYKVNDWLTSLVKSTVLYELETNVKLCDRILSASKDLKLFDINDSP